MRNSSLNFPFNFQNKFDSSEFTNKKSDGGEVEDNSVPVQEPTDEIEKEISPSPENTNTGVKEQETFVESNQPKPVTPDFSSITAAQVRIRQIYIYFV